MYISEFLKFNYELLASVRVLQNHSNEETDSICGILIFRAQDVLNREHNID